MIRFDLELRYGMFDYYQVHKELVRGSKNILRSCLSRKANFGSTACPNGRTLTATRIKWERHGGIVHFLEFTLAVETEAYEIFPVRKG